MNDILVFMFSYLAVFVMSCLVISFLQGGLFSAWLIVRMSREQKVLVKIRGQIKDRFRVGRVVDRFLVYSDNKAKKRLSMPEGAVYKAIGVFCVDTDEEKNAVMLRDYSAVSGFDAVKHENLHIRALTAPRLDDKQIKLLILLAVLAVAGVALVLFLVYNLSTQIEGLKMVAQTVPK